MSSDPPIDNADPRETHRLLLLTTLDEMARWIPGDPLPSPPFKKHMAGDAAAVIREQQAALGAERQWAAYLRCCALSGEIPTEREQFDDSRGP